MKRRIKLSQMSVFIFLMLGLSFISIAQQEGRMGRKGEMHKNRLESLEEHIPDLSAEQKESIKSIHLEVLKDMKPLRNELGEKEAELRTLRTQDEADLNAINAKIDQIASIKASIAKREAKAHQDIRSLLTEDQRVLFDMKSEKMRHRARKREHH